LALILLSVKTERAKIRYFTIGAIHINDFAFDQRQNALVVGRFQTREDHGRTNIAAVAKPIRPEMLVSTAAFMN
jgi:hypothetical protein